MGDTMRLKSKSLIGILGILLMVCLVTPTMAATTFGDAVVTTDRTGLEVTYNDHTYLFWYIKEVDEDGNSLIQYTLRHADLSKEETRVIDGTEYLLVEYRGVAKILIEDTGTSLVFEFEDLIQQRYPDSTFVLVYQVDGVGAELEFTQQRVGVHGATLTVQKTVEQQGFLQRIQEWFENLF